MIYHAILFSPLWLGLILIAVSTPMALRKVPPNPFYGFRTPKTQSSPEIWYASNEKAGINMIVACGASIFVWAVLWLCVGAARASVLGMPVLIVLLLAGLAWSFVQLSRM